MNHGWFVAPASKMWEIVISAIPCALTRSFEPSARPESSAVLVGFEIARFLLDTPNQFIPRPRRGGVFITLLACFFFSFPFSVLSPSLALRVFSLPHSPSWPPSLAALSLSAPSARCTLSHPGEREFGKIFVWCTHERDGESNSGGEREAERKGGPTRRSSLQWITSIAPFPVEDQAQANATPSDGSGFQPTLCAGVQPGGKVARAAHHARTPQPVPAVSHSNSLLLFRHPSTLHFTPLMRSRSLYSVFWHVGGELAYEFVCKCY